MFDNILYSGWRRKASFALAISIWVIVYGMCVFVTIQFGTLLRVKLLTSLPLNSLRLLERTNDSDPVLNREIVWKAKLMQWLSNNSTPPPIRLAPSFTLGRPEDQQSLRSLGMVATRGSESLAKCLAMNRTLASSLPTITPLTFIFCQTGNTTFTF